MNNDKTIKNCNFELLVAYVYRVPEHTRETHPLAQLIESMGVKTMLSANCWPRDSFFFNDDDTVMVVNIKNKDQKKAAPHWGWFGGAYLLGDNFMIADTGGIPSKYEATLNALKVDKGFYLATDKFYDLVKDISVSDYNEFFRPDSWHIDPFYNIGNYKKTLFSWDSPRMIKEIEYIAKEVKYDVAVLPMDDAKFAAIGFIELGDHIVIDCRAEKSMTILESIGYKVIPTPEPLIHINRKGGSLRCATKEAPPIKDRLKFHSFPYGNDIVGGPACGSLFGDLEGHMNLMDNSLRRKSLNEELFAKEYYG